MLASPEILEDKCAYPQINAVMEAVLDGFHNIVTMLLCYEAKTDLLGALIPMRREALSWKQRPQTVLIMSLPTSMKLGQGQTRD